MSRRRGGIASKLAPSLAHRLESKLSDDSTALRRTPRWFCYAKRGSSDFRHISPNEKAVQPHDFFIWRVLVDVLLTHNLALERNLSHQFETIFEASQNQFLAVKHPF